MTKDAQGGSGVRFEDLDQQERYTLWWMAKYAKGLSQGASEGFVEQLRARAETYRSVAGEARSDAAAISDPGIGDQALQLSGHFLAVLKGLDGAGDAVTGVGTFLPGAAGQTFKKLGDIKNIGVGSQKIISGVNGEGDQATSQIIDGASKLLRGGAGAAGHAGYVDSGAVAAFKAVTRIEEGTARMATGDPSGPLSGDLADAALTVAKAGVDFRGWGGINTANDGYQKLKDAAKTWSEAGVESGRMDQVRDSAVQSQLGNAGHLDGKADALDSYLNFIAAGQSGQADEMIRTLERMDPDIASRGSQDVLRDGIDAARRNIAVEAGKAGASDADTYAPKVDKSDEGTGARGLVLPPLSGRAGDAGGGTISEASERAVGESERAAEAERQAQGDARGAAGDSSQAVSSAGEAQDAETDARDAEATAALESARGQQLAGEAGLAEAETLQGARATAASSSEAESARQAAQLKAQQAGGAKETADVAARQAAAGEQSAMREQDRASVDAQQAGDARGEAVNRQAESEDQARTADVHEGQAEASSQQASEQQTFADEGAARAADAAVETAARREEAGAAQEDAEARQEQADTALQTSESARDAAGGAHAEAEQSGTEAQSQAEAAGGAADGADAAKSRTEAAREEAGASGASAGQDRQQAEQHEAEAGDAESAAAGSRLQAESLAAEAEADLTGVRSGVDELSANRLATESTATTAAHSAAAAQSSAEHAASISSQAEDRAGEAEERSADAVQFRAAVENVRERTEATRTAIESLLDQARQIQQQVDTVREETLAYREQAARALQAAQGSLADINSLQGIASKGLIWCDNEQSRASSAAMRAGEYV